MALSSVLNCWVVVLVTVSANRAKLKASLNDIAWKGSSVTVPKRAVFYRRWALYFAPSSKACSGLVEWLRALAQSWYPQSCPMRQSDVSNPDSALMWQNSVFWFVTVSCKTFSRQWIRSESQFWFLESAFRLMSWCVPIFRVEGLYRGGVLQKDELPVWYEVCKAFPPKVEPELARPLPNTKVRNLLYAEDYIRR